MPRSYATVEWTTQDIMELRPEWMEEEAEAFLEDNERRIQDRLLELSWEVIVGLLPAEKENRDGE